MRLPKATSWTRAPCSLSELSTSRTSLPPSVPNITCPYSRFVISNPSRTEDEFREYVAQKFYPRTPRALLAPVFALYPADPAKGSPFGTGDAYQLTPMYKRLAAFLGDFVWQAPRRYFLNMTAGKRDAWSFGESAHLLSNGHRYVDTNDTVHERGRVESIGYVGLPSLCYSMILGLTTSARLRRPLVLTRPYSRTAPILSKPSRGTSSRTTSSSLPRPRTRTAAAPTARSHGQSTTLGTGKC